MNGTRAVENWEKGKLKISKKMYIKNMDDIRVEGNWGSYNLKTKWMEIII